MAKAKRLYGDNKSYLNLYELNNGYQFASRKTIPLVDGNDKPDAVVIIAHDPNGRLLIIKEFRPVVGDFIWAFPAGLIDPGETAFQAAGREIKEETGLTMMVDPDGFTHYNNTYACPGMSDEKVVFVEGTVYGELSQAFQEKDENIVPYLMDSDQIVDTFINDPNVKMQSWLAAYLMG